ncbi:hypothetical protein Hrubri_0773 [Herbaspirillum rubrisubalbicans M1]|uniref:PEP-CTERM sorting domain-containing protein n=1 Tax=Herbaspirillum rubrisubalbicans TaxID=80842 RepID=UPI00073A233A|nr:PEP-CTERM sorting domain-containing protein [Herbaspirillum rubrisubalbicans]ALU87990.1 hypothetical protein Hrubri_0773 [Herbaspirillum rubrisubalbicans M1]
MKALIAAILLVASSIAVAAPGGHNGGGGSGNSGSSGGSTLVTPSVADVTLDGQQASSFTVASGNAQGGPNGDSALFSSAFGGGNWNLLSKFGSTGTLSGASSSVLGSTFTVSMNLGSDSTSGTWSITSSKSLQMDLVLGIHAGGYTGSFLFDNLVLNAGQTKSGTFVINWTSNGNQVPAFSNLTMFSANASLHNVAPVPEPSTYAMLLAGLALVGWMAWRRRSKLADSALLAAA